MSTMQGSPGTPVGKGLQGLERALAAFRHAYPAYEATSSLDDLRAREYSRLDEQDQVYLDYTGAGLYADSQLRQHMALLRSGVFGNPHSSSPAYPSSRLIRNGTRASISP